MAGAEHVVARTQPLTTVSGTRARLLVAGAFEIVPPALGIVGLLVLLEVWVRIASVPVFIVPAPTVSLGRLAERLPEYLFELRFTLMAAAAGLVFGTTIGILGSILMANWRLLEKSLFPLAVILKLTPFVAIAPLLVIWLGYNMWPKIVIATLITFFPVLVNCITGFKAADPVTVEFLRSIGASSAEVFWHLRWFSALPYLLAALRITVNLSLTGAIVGEILGTDNGIGKIMTLSLARLDMPSMFAAIALLAFTGVTLTVLTGAIERRALFWHESSLAEE
jgi:NitT/TauT family transport system permease protein